MKKQNLMRRIAGAALGISFLVGIGMLSMTSAQAQWGRDRRDRDYRRDRNDDYGRDRNDDYGRDRNDRHRGGGYGYGFRIARERGYEDGLQTGESDANRRQSYNPQRSHFFKNATYGYDRSFGNKEAYKQAYRDGFVRGYDEAFRSYGGSRRGRNGGNGRWFPW